MFLDIITVQLETLTSDENFVKSFETSVGRNLSHFHVEIRSIQWWRLADLVDFIGRKMFLYIDFGGERK